MGEREREGEMGDREVEMQEEEGEKRRKSLRERGWGIHLTEVFIVLFTLVFPSLSPLLSCSSPLYGNSFKSLFNLSNFGRH